MDIPDSESWVKVDAVNKGWSSDKKYYIETTKGTKLLLRLSNLDEKEIKQRDFELIKLIANQNINMSVPIEFGVCGENSVYTLFTWVDGEDLEIVLPSLDRCMQYNLGYKAGITLKRIHDCKFTEEPKNWEDRYNIKLDRNISMYNNCPVKYKGADKIIDYINRHRHLLNGRPQVLQHGDYHTGNMVIKNGDVGIIDFNRLDIGDPWEEFNRISFCATISGDFASGMINGYFNDDVPDDFFKLLALYIGSNQLSSIPWAMNFGEEDVNYMIQQARLVLKWYNDYNYYIPSWYTSKNLKVF